MKCVFLTGLSLLLLAATAEAQGVRYVGQPPANLSRDLQECSSTTGGVDTAMLQCMIAKGWSAQVNVPGTWGGSGGQDWPAPIAKPVGR